jgi:hypothetical protein
MAYATVIAKQLSSMPPRGSLARKRKREDDAAAPAASSSGGAPPNVPAATSMLFRHLIYLWSWGFLSLPFCQKIAMYATADLTNAGGRPYDDLTWLGKIGDSGRYPANMYTETLRRLEKPLVGPPRQCLLPYKTSPMVVADKAAGILLPHEMFASIYHNYPAIWHSRIVETNTVLEEFWDAMDGHPLLAHMKLRNREDGYRQNAVPLRIHGDDTPVTGIGKSWTKVCLFFSWTAPSS